MMVVKGCLTLLSIFIFSKLSQVQGDTVEEPCIAFDSIANGEISCYGQLTNDQRLPSKSLCTMYCNMNYQVSGPNQIYCKDGLWYEYLKFQTEGEVPSAEFEDVSCVSIDITTPGTTTADVDDENMVDDGVTDDNDTDDNATDDNSTHKNATDDNAVDANSTKENSTDDNVTFDNSTEDNATDDNAVDVNSKDENATDDNVTNENSSDDNATDNNPSDDSAINVDNRESSVTINTGSFGGDLSSLFGDMFTEGNGEDAYDYGEGVNVDLDEHIDEWTMRSGLSCYECSVGEDGCDGSSLDQYLRNCSVGENFCQIMKLKTESSTTLVARSCADEEKNVEDCPGVCTIFTSCSTDGCNHGNEMHVFSHVISFLGLFIAFLLTR